MVAFIGFGAIFTLGGDWRELLEFAPIGDR
jgi:hypothetical protein